MDVDKQTVLNWGIEEFGEQKIWAMILSGLGELVGRLADYSIDQVPDDTLAESIADGLVLLQMGRLMVGEDLVDRHYTETIEMLSKRTDPGVECRKCGSRDINRRSAAGQGTVIECRKCGHITEAT